MRWGVITGAIGLALLALAGVDAWPLDRADDPYDVTGVLEGVSLACGVGRTGLDEDLRAVLEARLPPDRRQAAWFTVLIGVADDDQHPPTPALCAEGRREVARWRTWLQGLAGRTLPQMSW